MKRLSAKEKRELIGILESFKEKIHRFVHHENCSRIDECPGKHALCRPGLNTATALLWDLKENELIRIIGNPSNKNIRFGVYVAACYKQIIKLSTQYHEIGGEIDKYTKGYRILSDITDTFSSYGFDYIDIIL